MLKREPIEQINALLAFYFKIEPNNLSDEEWAMNWARLEFSLEWMQKNRMNSFGI